jgi:tRNA (guanine37-N1)-methyltransferase
LLDFPQYTRPATLAWPGASHLAVPDVLLSGNHGDIRRWRKREAVTRTLERRPDLLADARLDDEEEKILRELQDGGMAGLQKVKAES